MSLKNNLILGGAGVALATSITGCGDVNVKIKDSNLTATDSLNGNTITVPNTQVGALDGNETNITSEPVIGTINDIIHCNYKSGQDTNLTVNLNTYEVDENNVCSALLTEINNVTSDVNTTLKDVKYSNILSKIDGGEFGDFTYNIDNIDSLEMQEGETIKNAVYRYAQENYPSFTSVSFDNKTNTLTIILPDTNGENIITKKFNNFFIKNTKEEIETPEINEIVKSRYIYGMELKKIFDKYNINCDLDGFFTQIPSGNVTIIDGNKQEILVDNGEIKNLNFYETEMKNLDFIFNESGEYIFNIAGEEIKFSIN